MSTLTHIYKITLRKFSQRGFLYSGLQTMEKCYFRFEDGEDRFQITFTYKDESKKINRQFNFSRLTCEPVETLINRMTANLEKVVNRKKQKKKKQEESKQEEDEPLDIKLFEGDTEVKKTLTCDQLLNKANLRLVVLDKEFKVVINHPWVVKISLPNSILCGFPVYPVNFELQFASKDSSNFLWFAGAHFNDGGAKISDEHIKWNLVGEGYTYTPKHNDIGLKLKVQCVPSNGEIQGPSAEAISSVVVEAGPGKCPFEDRHAFTRNKLSGKSFRVVTYNILADLYCDSDYTRAVLHPYCPPYALQMDYRKQLIIKEVLGYNADIICLQEVDRKIFIHELVPVLESVGMIGDYARKGKEVAEGAACFFRKDRFRMLSSSSIVLAVALQTLDCLKHIWDIIRTVQPLADRILDRSTVAQSVILQSTDNTDEILVVGNTHLYFHPDADHIRLLQGGAVIAWLNFVADEIRKQNPNKRVSLILCGDFNSVPSCGIYKLYTEGVAPETLPDWLSNEKEAVHNARLEQPTVLASACGTPQYTNFTAEFADCLDYIYYAVDGLDVEQVVPLPSVEELKEHTALPSVVFPSDHVSLVADLKFK